MGFEKCNVSRSTYVHNQGNDVTRLSRHTDDFRISGKDEKYERS
jgi:hypothetical protein